MPTIQFEKMHAIVLYVSDLTKAKAFYIEHLGFEFCETMGSGIVMKGGGVLIFIEGGYTKRETVPAMEADVSVCFNVKGGVREAFEKLQKANVTIAAKYQEVEPGFAFFRFADPDGNVFEISGEP
jgi:catechol 2,3-dioxygenase-like lactoylglutathione lyase family enzyme